LGSIFGGAGKAVPPENKEQASAKEFHGVQEGKELSAHPGYPSSWDLDKPMSELEKQRSLERMNNLCFWENRQYVDVD